MQRYCLNQRWNFITKSKGMGWKRRISNCSCNFLKAMCIFFYFIPKVKNVLLWPSTCSCQKEELSQFITLYFPVMESFFSSFSPCTNKQQNPHPPPTPKKKHFASAGTSERDAQKIIQCPFLQWLARSVQAQHNHSFTIPSTIALNCNLVDLLWESFITFQVLWIVIGP